MFYVLDMNKKKCFQCLDFCDFVKQSEKCGDSFSYVNQVNYIEGGGG